jgi:hypothetical protein
MKNIWSISNCSTLFGLLKMSRISFCLSWS